MIIKYVNHIILASTQYNEGIQKLHSHGDQSQHQSIDGDVIAFVMVHYSRRVSVDRFS